MCDMLSGKTFTAASRPPGYKAETQACLDLQEFAEIFVQWVVDIYNNTEHDGLFGLTPAQQWEVDIEQGNYPLHALPDKRTRRLAFGKRLERKLQKDGLHVLGLRYQCPKLALYWIRNPSATMSLRWDCADIGAIEVSIDGEWVEAEAAFETAPDGSPVDGMHYQEWIAVIRALRAKARNRKSFDEAAVFDAINSIRATDEAKRVAFKLISLHPDDEQIKKFENTLLDGFRISVHRKSLKATASGYGETITPMSPSDANPASVDTGSGVALPRKKSKKINIGE
jgi:putative transposase